MKLFYQILYRVLMQMKNPPSERSSVMIHKQSFMREMLLTAAVVMMLAPIALIAGEHPEHPSEHPKKEAQLDPASVASAIEDFINTDAKLKGGMFLLWDSQQKKPLSLQLTKIHNDKISKLKDERVFVCADFMSSDSVAYDLDFFMHSSGPKPIVTEIMVHKQAGKPRYTWVEENGVWNRKPL